MTLSSEEKETYAWIECTGCKIRGYDSFICTYGDLPSMLMEPLDDVEMGVEVTFKVTLHELTEKEFQAFCDGQEIDSWK